VYLKIKLLSFTLTTYKTLNYRFFIKIQAIKKKTIFSLSKKKEFFLLFSKYFQIYKLQCNFTYSVILLRHFSIDKKIIKFE